MLVFPSDLEEVEEICGTGVNAYQVLIACWGWVREFRDFELCWSLVLVSLGPEGEVMDVP